MQFTSSSPFHLGLGLPNDLFPLGLPTDMSNALIFPKS